MDNKNNKKEFLPIILGSDENAYGMARAFYQKYAVISILLCRLPLVATRYSKILEIRQFDNFDDEDVFIKNLCEVAEEKIKEYDKLILVPCSDRYTELTIKNTEIVEKYFCNKFTSYDLFLKFNTKDKFYNICEEYGLPYPKTVICEYKDRLSILDRLEFDFPIVVKANNSLSYAFLNCEFEGKKKVFFVKTREEYIRIIENMNKSEYKDNIIIQALIPGDDTSARVLNCYSDNNGKVRLMCLGKPVLEEYAPSALGNYAAILTDIDKNNESRNKIFEQIKNFLESIKYMGFSNFDMKYDVRSGGYKFYDFNPRQGRSSFFVTAAGYNLAEFLIDNAVYNKNKDITYADNDTDMLWLSIPKKILFKYVENAEVLERVKRLIKEKKYMYTLLYKKDMNLKRFLRMKLFYHKHHKEYKMYFFKKDKSL